MQCSIAQNQKNVRHYTGNFSVQHSLKEQLEEQQKPDYHVSRALAPHFLQEEYSLLLDNLYLEKIKVSLQGHLNYLEVFCKQYINVLCIVFKLFLLLQRILVS